MLVYICILWLCQDCLKSKHSCDNATGDSDSMCKKAATCGLSVTWGCFAPGQDLAAVANQSWILSDLS